jgi:hypothetical protein
MTAIRDAFKKAGAQTGAALLYAIAAEQLRRNDMHIRKAAAGVVEEAVDSGGLLVDLIPKETVLQHALLLVERVAKDMRDAPKGAGAVPGLSDSRFIAGRPTHSPQGESAARKHGDGQRAHGRAQLSPRGDAAAHAGCDSQPEDGGGENSPKGEAGVHRGFESQKVNGPRQDSSQEDGTAQRHVDSRRIGGSPDSSPQGADGDGVRVCSESRSQSGPTPSENRAGSVNAVDENPSPALAPPAKPARGFAELKALREASPPSVFDAHKLRDGLPIGDLRYSQLDRYIATNAREAYLLLLIKNHARPHDENMRVREIIKQDVLEKMIADAKEWPSEPRNIETLRPIAGTTGAQEVLHQGRD